MTFKYFDAVLLLAIAGVTTPAVAAKKKQHVHDHGAAKLAIAVDGQVVALDLDTPAQGLYGFEYEPKSAADQKIVRDANAKFTAHAAELFKFPADLGCTVVKSKVEKEAASAASGEAHQQTHADLNIGIEFHCSKPVSGARMSIALIKAFPLIKKLMVTINTGTRQGSQMVTQPEQELSL